MKRHNWRYAIKKMNDRLTAIGRKKIKRMRNKVKKDQLKAQRRVNEAVQRRDKAFHG